MMIRKLQWFYNFSVVSGISLLSPYLFPSRHSPSPKTTLLTLGVRSPLIRFDAESRHYGPTVSSKFSHLPFLFYAYVLRCNYAGAL